MDCIQCLHEGMQKTLLSTLLGIHSHRQVFGRNPEISGREPLLTRRWVKAMQNGHDILDHVAGVCAYKMPHVCMLNEDKDTLVPVAQHQMENQDQDKTAAKKKQRTDDYFGPFFPAPAFEPAVEAPRDVTAVEGQAEQAAASQSVVPEPDWLAQPLEWEMIPTSDPVQLPPELEALLNNYVPVPGPSGEELFWGEPKVELEGVQDWIRMADMKRTLPVEECHEYGREPCKRERLEDWA